MLHEGIQSKLGRGEPFNILLPWEQILTNHMDFMEAAKKFPSEYKHVRNIVELEELLEKDNSAESHRTNVFRIRPLENIFYQTAYSNIDSSNDVIYEEEVSVGKQPFTQSFNYSVDMASRYNKTMEINKHINIEEMFYDEWTIEKCMEKSDLSLFFTQVIHQYNNPQDFIFNKIRRLTNSEFISILSWLGKYNTLAEGLRVLGDGIKTIFFSMVEPLCLQTNVVFVLVKKFIKETNLLCSFFSCFFVDVYFVHLYRYVLGGYVSPPMLKMVKKQKYDRRHLIKIGVQYLTTKDINNLMQNIIMVLRNDYDISTVPIPALIPILVHYGDIEHWKKLLESDIADSIRQHLTTNCNIYPHDVQLLIIEKFGLTLEPTVPDNSDIEKYEELDQYLHHDVIVKHIVSDFVTTDKKINMAIFDTSIQTDVLWGLSKLIRNKQLTCWDWSRLSTT
ncbi:hypothetical protein [Salmon gill poxvirus]|nr:hypothetical protein [Salmon gill poxvirus]